MSKSIEIFKIDVCKLPMKKREEFYSLFSKMMNARHANNLSYF